MWMVAYTPGQEHWLTIDDRSRSGEDGNLVKPLRPIPQCHRQPRPVHQVMTDDVADDWPSKRRDVRARSRQVGLVEKVVQTCWEVGVILVAVCVLDVESWRSRSRARTRTLLISWPARLIVRPALLRVGQM